MPATQQIIDYGATANDGTGDPLRDAFIKTDENFSNIWLAGPVGSNIVITNNTIEVTNTNGNLILMPNGIGVIESRNHFVPRFNNTYDLGTTNLKWRKIYAGEVSVADLGVSGDLTVSGNLTVTGNVIETGNVITDALTIQLANTAANAAQANGAGITVGANDDIATLLYDSSANVWITNIGITSPGNISSPRVIAQEINVANIIGPQITVTATATDDATWTFQNWTNNNGQITFPSGLIWESDHNTNADYIKGNYGGIISIEAYHPDSTISSALHLQPTTAWIETTLSSNPELSYRWVFNDFGDLIAPGKIVPDTSGIFSLGNLTNRWGNLYIANTNITNANVIINAEHIVNIATPEINLLSNQVNFNNQVNIGTDISIPGVKLQVFGTKSMLVPVGNTDQRPTDGVTGMLRFNTTLDTLEFYDSDSWVAAKPDFTVITADKFNGDGSTVEFTLSESSTTNGVVISINGIVQEPNEAYSVSGTVLLFTEAPGPSDVIDVRILTTTVSVGQLSNSSGNAVVSVNPTSAQVNITGSLVPTANATEDIGNTSRYFNRVYAVSTSAVYSDLAEMYAADATYPPGTVLSFGGNAEVTESRVDADERVAGVVSIAPSYLMNSTLSGDNVVALALMGRVPTRVTGSIRKGDMMVSNGDGRARAESNPRMGAVIGKSLANFNGADGMIEVVIGRL